MTTLTRDVRDRAVAALRKAHDEGRTVLTHAVAAERPDGGIDGCSCYVIAQEFGIELTSAPNQRPRPTYAKEWHGVGDRFGDTHGGQEIYKGLNDLGFQPHIGSIFLENDLGKSFDRVADLVATFIVVDEAEAICRDAAGTALVGA